GVGRVKLDRFGRDFLETIREYGALHGTGQAVPTAPAPAPQKRPAPGRTRRPRHLEIAVRFNEGTSVARLAEEYQVKETTILAHLHKALVQGFSLEKHGPLPELSHLSTAQQAAVDEAFERLGTERLGPLFTALNQEVGYDDLALLRLRYLLGK
ncbi:MAG: helix-turn-helix domain-containing protein, partial [Deltaproteobacteria bacterium]|nr:helix-turn-helix domain-containing protein [Deltaproteobacteria bacterium]